jgi:NAD(P)H dehydrogenase (quinone)
MRINVMAASGQLGRKVMGALLDQGAMPADLTASVRTLEKAADLAVGGIRLRRADYDDPGSLVEAYIDTDVLLLIASVASVEERIVQHYNALEAAKQAGVKRVVFVSFAAAAPESEFHIAPFSLYAEAKVRQSGLEWTILRDGMYLDPVADWVPDLVKMGRLPYPVRTGRVAYISRDDIARALAAACLDSSTAGNLYELTGPQALTMSEVADAISQVTGRTVTFDSISEEEYMAICLEDGIPEPFAKVLASMYRAVENGEFETVTDHVQQLTGTPAETVESYLRRTVQID